MNNLFPLDPRIRRPNGTRQDPPPSHPSRGGNPYSDEMRRMVLQMHFNGVNLQNPLPNLPISGSIISFHAILPVKIGYKPITQLVIFAR